MSLLERIPEDQLQPRKITQDSPSMHQTPLYVLMTPEVKTGELFTLPEGKLLQGLRGSTSIERNAFHIVNNAEINDQKLDFAPKARGWIGDEESRPFGMAFLVERAHEDIKKKHDFKDLRTLHPTQPTPEHNSTLELHDHTSLLARLALINKLDIKNNMPPSRLTQEIFVRKFGEFVTRHNAY